MKIVRLSTFLDFGGIESKMANLSRYNDNYNEWIFVAINKGGAAETKIKNNGKKVVCLGLSYSIPSLKTILELYLFLKKEKPDVLHNSGAEANFFGFVAGKLAGIPKVIVEEIGIPHWSAKARFIFKNIFSRADKVVGESEVVVRNISEILHLHKAKTCIVPNFGIFDYDFSKVFANKDFTCFNIVTISRLESVKNIEGLLYVFLEVVKRTGRFIKLTICGSGNSELKLKELVEKLDLKSKVVFVGFVDDPYPYLLNSDLFVLNSLSEGFSNSILEAMYSKTPVLSTAVGAAPDIIKDDVNGFLVPPGDNAKLLDKMIHVLSLPLAELQRIGENGHYTVTGRFTLQRHVNALIELYQS
ncbi:glycosyltransferase [Niabella terrae]